MLDANTGDGQAAKVLAISAGSGRATYRMKGGSRFEWSLKLVFAPHACINPNRHCRMVDTGRFG